MLYSNALAYLVFKSLFRTEWIWSEKGGYFRTREMCSGVFVFCFVGWWLIVSTAGDVLITNGNANCYHLNAGVGSEGGLLSKWRKRRSLRFEFKLPQPAEWFAKIILAYLFPVYGGGAGTKVQTRRISTLLAYNDRRFVVCEARAELA